MKECLKRLEWTCIPFERQTVRRHCLTCYHSTHASGIRDTPNSVCVCTPFASHARESNDKEKEKEREGIKREKREQEDTRWKHVRVKRNSVCCCWVDPRNGGNRVLWHVCLFTLTCTFSAICLSFLFPRVHSLFSLLFVSLSLYVANASQIHTMIVVCYNTHTIQCVCCSLFPLFSVFVADCQTLLVDCLVSLCLRVISLSNAPSKTRKRKREWQSSVITARHTLVMSKNTVYMIYTMPSSQACHDCKNTHKWHVLSLFSLFTQSHSILARFWM